ncbi:hypothetical protein FLM9_294 [Candidatus Synechococcus spongiarum]|uniref:Uncharacterized protein n=1 Tax=Candidatus Synechococcus spongiarum TaxID=431041 RepID=A0A170T4V8_9SYNE|nr:hypothetical protein FLM9_294 [Candidatus Synechococcus spongiarum]
MAWRFLVSELKDGSATGWAAPYRVPPHPSILPARPLDCPA